MKKSQVLLCLIFILFTCRRSHAQLEFAVIGDTPYSTAGEAKLKSDIEENNCFSNADFLIHIGDIKSGGPCSEEHYSKIAMILKASKIPVFIIPGDNEYNDCESPTVAWTFWEKHLLDFEKNFSHGFIVSRQEKRRENFAFVYKQTLVIGINSVGGKVHDMEEWETRLKDNGDWIQTQLVMNKELVSSAVIFGHSTPNSIAEFRNRFRDAVKAFDKPVLFVQGDSHKWLYKPEWLTKNLSWVIIDEGRVQLPILQVSVNNGLKPAFSFNREAWKINAICNDVAIYPNPTNGTLHLTYDNRYPGKCVCLVYDLSGRVVLKEDIHLESRHLEKDLDLTGFPQGPYLVRLISDERSVTEMIFKRDF